jgi:hypothetical protein
MCLCPLYIIVKSQFFLYKTWPHACDTMWNLGGANTICYIGCVRPRVTVGSGTCPTLICLSCILSRCSTSWATPPGLFWVGNFHYGVSWTFWLDCPPSMIILNSASSVAQTIDQMNHCHSLWFLRQDLAVYQKAHYVAQVPETGNRLCQLPECSHDGFLVPYQLWSMSWLCFVIHIQFHIVF